MTKILAAVAAAAALSLAGAAASPARAPDGFIGISPQSAPLADDFELMARAGIRSVRVPLYWSQVEAAEPRRSEPDWSGFDRSVELAARHGMEVLPFVWGTPSWLSQEHRIEPVEGRARRAWSGFLRRAVRRYGPRGEFWLDHEELERRPIRLWEIWNEPNIVTFGETDPERFARLIVISGRAIRAVDGRARLIIGGFFGRPLQVPPNIPPGRFLDRIYAAGGGVKRWFDGVGLHPYVAAADAMRNQILNLRRVMRRHGDARTPIYVTEVGWGSDGFESRWERGLRGQARQLDRAFGMLSNRRRQWRIGGVWWFSWADADGPACQFCDSAGLLTRDREAKPSWFRFNAWTGGDPDTVPRARTG